MHSTFMGIEIGKRSLMAHTQGLATIGHNLSNASTEGYSRQRVRLGPMEPLYAPQLNRAETPGQIGQGVVVERIERIRDQLLEGRIIAQSNGEGYWGARDKYIMMLEEVYNEPTEVSVRSLLDKFWQGWQELSINPQESAARKAVIQRAEMLLDGIKQRYKSLSEIREMAELDVQAVVEKINTLTSDIAGLNERIVKVKAMGDNPNDLLDRRDLLVEKLSSLIDITVDNRDPDEFVVHSGGIHIVQGRIHRPLKTVIDPENEGYSTVVWSDWNEEAHFRGGELAALLELRDGDIRYEIQNLDLMTMNLVDMVNDIHSQGYGLDGETGRDFFVEYPFVTNVAGNYDTDGDGEFDSTYLFRITGSNRLNPQDQVGLGGEMILSGPEGPITVGYNPTDTVEDIVERINTSGAEVVAGFDMNNHLYVKATPAAVPENPDFVLGHLEDTGQFLVGYAGILAESGPEGSFDRNEADAVTALAGGDVTYAVAPLSHPSGWVTVNPALERDVSKIAAGFGIHGRPALSGDGSAALAVAELRNTEVMIGRLNSFDEYFAAAVATVGLKGEEAEIALKTQELIMKDLKDMRESISGVNIDEELSNMIKFQHGYSAAARFVTAYDRLLDTIINRMGV